MRRPRSVGRVTVKIPRFFRLWLNQNLKTSIKPSCLGFGDTKPSIMKKIVFTFLVLFCSISGYAQHTWDFSDVEYLDVEEYKNVQLIDAQLPCKRFGKMNVVNYTNYGTEWFPNIYFWGQTGISSVSASTWGNTYAIALNGFIEIPGFDANTDSLVVTYHGWNGSSYDDNMVATLNPLDFYNSTPKKLFIVNSSRYMMFIRYIDWYRNHELITDPANVVSGMSNVQVPKKHSGDTYNIEGVKVFENTKGVVIKDGKKYLQK